MEALTQKQAAAAYTALLPHLSEILQRGTIAVLEAQEPERKSGLSWCLVSNEQLLKMDSENAAFEKLRRAIEALELFNMRSPNRDRYFPTAEVLSDLTLLDTEFVASWLLQPGIKDEIELFKRTINLGAQSAHKFNQLSGELRKPKPHERIKWSEAYGAYK